MCHLIFAEYLINPHSKNKPYAIHPLLHRCHHNFGDALYRLSSSSKFRVDCSGSCRNRFPCGNLSLAGISRRAWPYQVWSVCVCASLPAEWARHKTASQSTVKTNFRATHDGHSRLWQLKTALASSPPTHIHSICTDSGGRAQKDWWSDQKNDVWSDRLPPDISGKHLQAGKICIQPSSVEIQAIKIHYWWSRIRKLQSLLAE